MCFNYVVQGLCKVMASRIVPYNGTVAATATGVFFFLSDAEMGRWIAVRHGGTG